MVDVPGGANDVGHVPDSLVQQDANKNPADYSFVSLGPMVSLPFHSHGFGHFQALYRMRFSGSKSFV